MYDADRFLEVPNLNIIWGLVAALRYDFNDPQPKKQFQYLRTFLGEKLAGKSTFWRENSKIPFSKKNVLLLQKIVFCTFSVNCKMEKSFLKQFTLCSNSFSKLEKIALKKVFQLCS